MSRRWFVAVPLGITAVLISRTLVRPWHENWGATDDEVSGTLPGDELVREPASQGTRAITIDAAPSDVWPWIVQLGADRGGFYSYDWLENLFRLGIHSADRIVPEWQRRSVGELVHGNATGTGGWYVMDVRPNEALVLQTADVRAGRPARREEGFKWEFLWTFALRAGGDGSTRLLVRERVGFGSRLTRLVMAPVGIVSFLMTRKMLRGVKARAEARQAPTSTMRAPVTEERDGAPQERQ